MRSRNEFVPWAKAGGDGVMVSHALLVVCCRELVRVSLSLQAFLIVQIAAIMVEVNGKKPIVGALAI